MCVCVCVVSCNNIVMYVLLNLLSFCTSQPCQSSERAWSDPPAGVVPIQESASVKLSSAASDSNLLSNNKKPPVRQTSFVSATMPKLRQNQVIRGN